MTEQLQDATAVRRPALDEAKQLATLRAKAALRGIVVTSMGPTEFMVSFRGAWRMAEGLDDLREVLRRMGVSDQ